MLSSLSIFASLIVTLMWWVISASNVPMRRSRSGIPTDRFTEDSRSRERRSTDESNGCITVRSNVSHVAKSRSILSSAYFDINFAVWQSRSCIRATKSRRRFMVRSCRFLSSVGTLFRSDKNTSGECILGRCMGGVSNAIFRFLWALVVCGVNSLGGLVSRRNLDGLLRPRDPFPTPLSPPITDNSFAMLPIVVSNCFDMLFAPVS
mmetsp:Transcript_146/g.287  ORF Transcript_146/g.287 Transcript_146/m.287 type:complete len:206 (-) Transcript_146:115-732(-)